MHKIADLLKNIEIAYPGRRRNICRLIVVLCLYGLLAWELPSSAAIVSDSVPPVTGGTHIGMGGGSLIGAAETGVLEMGVLEPESFSKPRMLLYSSYTVKKGDIIGDLAANFGLTQDTLISMNGIKNSRLLQIGQTLRIPNQDGVMYTVKKTDTLETIAEKYEANTAAIALVNELLTDTAIPGSTIFIPGARLDWVERQEINGDLFIWPTSGVITSYYGYRKWPFGGFRQFHSGLDIGAKGGSPIRAAMSGRVSAVGWDDVLGNFVVVSHHSGYRTLYAHMSLARVKSGAYVATGERIGDVGSTGMSTGDHLHFTVYKSGKTVNPLNLMK